MDDNALGSFRALLRAGVEPVVRPAGFFWTSNGGYSAEKGTMTALFEANDEEFGPAFPSLMPGKWAEDPVGCVDLWIHYDVKGHLIEAQLGTSDVAAWLREQGHASMAETLEAPLDLEAAVEALARALELILSEARGDRAE